MKPNPKNYEGFVDPEGGEWIKVKTGMYKGAIWRPADMKLVNEETGEVSYGVIPEGSVVVSGSLPSKDQKYSLYCAVIVKKVDEKTRSKVGINELLREA